MYRTAILLALFILGCSRLSHQANNNVQIQVLYSWRFADFVYPSEESRQVAVQQGRYVPENVVILDSDIYFSPGSNRKRVFVTTPNFRPGIPATLSEVSREQRSGAYLLRPFPSLDAQSTTTCEGPSSVYRIHIDRCGLLWVLDTGRIETFTNARRACRPKLLIYDLNQNDNLLVRYEFPDSSLDDRSNLVTVVTESYQSDCRDSIAYIADVNAYGLVVYDLAQGTSWRVAHNYFYPFPHKGTITINSVTFDLMDGIFGLALSPPTDNPRRLYFHSLASARESWVPTSVLRNQTLIQNTEALRSQFWISEDVREGQSSLEVMTDDGILIYPILPRTAIACWNSAHPFKKETQHILYQDLENLQFVSGMKLHGNVLLITTSRLQNYIAGNLNNQDIKYRLIVIEDVRQMLRGTPCQSSYSNTGTSGTGIGRPVGNNNRQPTSPPRKTTNYGSGSSSHY